MDKKAKKRVPLKLDDGHIKVISASLASMKAEGPPVPAMGGLEQSAKDILHVIARGWSPAMVAARLTRDLNAEGIEIEIGAHHIQRLLRKLKDATALQSEGRRERKPTERKEGAKTRSNASDMPGTATVDAKDEASRASPIQASDAPVAVSAERPETAVFMAGAKPSPAPTSSSNRRPQYND